jgi:hypothetical protein
MTTDSFCFYLQNRLIQTSQTGGQWYSDTSPLVFPGSLIQGLHKDMGWRIVKNGTRPGPQKLPLVEQMKEYQQA